MAELQQPGNVLAEILTVERRGANEYSACLENFWGQAQGGDMAARAVLAAADTCPGKELHALYASYVRPAPPATPLTLHVESLVSSPSIARCRVSVRDDELLSDIVITFGTPRAGPAYEAGGFAPGIPLPETLPSTRETARAEGWGEYADGPLEFRRVGPWWPEQSPQDGFAHREWISPRIALPPEARIHMAALAFLGDFYSHWPYERRVGRAFAYDAFRPYDYALWVHAPVHWTDWWMVCTASPVGRDGRGFGRREIYTRTEQLIASSAQHAHIATS